MAAPQTLPRIDEQVVKDEVQKAGFKLVAEGNFLRNPSDPRDWNASPGAAAKAGKRGTSDRFALKFVRLEGTQAQPIPPALRLPAGARPTHVTAELKIDPTKDDFEGTEQIDLALGAPTPLLWLDAEKIKILETTPPATIIEAPPDFVRLSFAQPLPAANTTLELHYSGKLP